MNVFNLFPRRSDMKRCMQRLAEHSETGVFTGIAFVGYIPGRGWIADTCGEAREKPRDALEALDALENKLIRLSKSR